ncbi:MAG TPA: hypothetical protein VEY11_19405 [Pyrinomonadaceae bacterium]|nr:hypothetical protein [Pyrinomonadaceae bacterium]
MQTKSDDLIVNLPLCATTKRNIIAASKPEKTPEPVAKANSIANLVLSILD